MIEAAVAWPNPGSKAILFKLSGPADRMVLRLYTPAWVKVLEWNGGTWGAGWNRLELESSEASLPTGLLYARLQAQRGAVFSEAKTVRVFVKR